LTSPGASIWTKWPGTRDGVDAFEAGHHLAHLLGRAAGDLLHRVVVAGDEDDRHRNRLVGALLLLPPYVIVGAVPVQATAKAGAGEGVGVHVELGLAQPRPGQLRRLGRDVEVACPRWSGHRCRCSDSRRKAPRRPAAGTREHVGRARPRRLRERSRHHPRACRRARGGAGFPRVPRARAHPHSGPTGGAAPDRRTRSSRRALPAHARAGEPASYGVAGVRRGDPRAMDAGGGLQRRARFLPSLLGLSQADPVAHPAADRRRYRAAHDPMDRRARRRVDHHAARGRHRRPGSAR